MHQFFAQDPQRQKVYVLYGLGGAGKTQIALKFIEDWTNFTDRILLDASTTETIEMGLTNIATIKQSGNSSYDGLSWLVGKHEDWLLLFDNADAPEINLSHFFPKCSHGNIIITSRNPNLQIHGGHSEVSNMEEADAVELLLKSAQQESSVPNKHLALPIVKALWYFPLAIVQAGAFILGSGTLDTYLGLFVENRNELLKRKLSQTTDGYKWTVYTTWEMSFQKLSPLAARFLQLCSFIHRDDISEDIFSSAANYATKLPVQPHQKRLQKLQSKFVSGPSKGASEDEIAKAREFLSHFTGSSGEWNSLSFLDLTDEIKAYSLINFDRERKTFSIHPLVHSWSRTTLANPKPYLLCMSAILGMSIEGTSLHNRGLASLRLISHIDSLVQVDPKLTTNLQQQFAIIYYHIGQYTEADADREAQLARDNDPHIVSRNNVHRTEEAKKLQLVVLEDQKKLGEDHPNTLLAMHNLAMTYQKLGQWEEARRLQVMVVEKQQKLLGVDHSDTLQAMTNLASTYNALGQFKEAEQLQIVVLEKQKMFLGPDHPNTGVVMNNLAMVYHNQGQFKKAEHLHSMVLEKRRNALGQFEEAEHLQSVLLEQCRSFFRDDHPETLRAMNNLGWTHYSQGHLGKAEELQVVALDKHRSLFGDHTRQTRLAMRNLHITYKSLNKQAEAAEIHKLITSE
ncbi:hypothetical protein C8R45DRAFT_1054713 [Mycena sanguinolenta]|nr:hypothetical protein C8R45DRAFT_1054713 [Mycena sanguinolenta]